MSNGLRNDACSKLGIFLHASNWRVTARDRTDEFHDRGMVLVAVSAIGE